MKQTNRFVVYAQRAVLCVGSSLALLLAAPITASADRVPTIEHPQSDAHITGHVLNAHTKEHIKDATIIIQEINVMVTTDASGHYTFRHQKPGKYTITMLADGFLTQSKSIELKKGTTVEVNFEAVPDETQLEEVVISANRQRTLRRYAPTLISVIDEKVFQLSNAVNLAGGLTFKPGIRVENDCQNCGFNQVRINGLDGRYSQILIDSRPIFSSLAGVYGLEQLPTNMIDRVEVVRGGGSALYGSSAIAGVINVITKEPTSNSYSFTENLSLTGGKKPDNTVAFNGTLLSPDGKIGAMLFGQHRTREAWDANGDGYSEIGQIESRSLGTRTFFRITPLQRLTMEFHSTQEKRRGGDHLDRPEHVVGIAESVQHSIYSGNAHYNLRSEDDHHHLDLFASGQHILRNSYYGGIGDANVGSLGKPTLKEEYGDNYGRTVGNIAMGGAQYTFNIDRLFFMPGQILLGAEYLYDRLQDNMPILALHKAGNGESQFPALDQQIHNFSQLAQVEWKNKTFTLLLGGRLDEHSLVRNAKGAIMPIFTPRATLRYNPESWINLRASYAKGFRAPQIFDENLHVAVVNGEAKRITNAANLHPEYSHSVSLSNDMYFTAGSMQANLLVEGFYTRLIGAFNSVVDHDNPLSKHGFNTYKRVNGSDANVFGVNLEGKIAWHRVSVQGGFTFTKSQWTQAQETGVERSLLVGEDPDAPQEINTLENHGPENLAGFLVEDGEYQNIEFKSKEFIKTPETYGYLTINYNPISTLNLTATCNYTGSMYVPHAIKYGRGSATVDRELINAGKRPSTAEEESAPAWGQLVKTKSFFDLGLRMSYDIDLFSSSTLQLYLGANNLLNSFQKDFDFGSFRDSAYIYGPTQPRTVYMGLSLKI